MMKKNVLNLVAHKTILVVRAFSFIKILTFFLLTVCFVVFTSSQLVATEATTETDISDTDSKEPATKQQRWAAFPILASSPETGFMFGGMLFHFLPVDSPSQQASTIDLMAFATTKDQYEISLSPNIFIDDYRYRFNSSFFYYSWTANYYGIGNDSSDDKEEYNSEGHGVNITFEREWFDSFVTGLLGSYSSEDVTTKAGGMLQTQNVPGSTDFNSVGLGIRVGFDTRDNTNAAHIGTLAVLELTWYDKAFGSDYDFNIQSLDLRHYIPVLENSVLALSVQFKDSHGEVPIRLLPSPDGTMLLRGIENGRYRDNMLLGFQSEFRFPVRNKFSGTLFAEAAQVARDYSDLAIDSFKTSIGAGIRYALNPEQRFNLRADVAWVDNGIGLIINVREAF